MGMRAWHRIVPRGILRHGPRPRRHRGFLSGSGKGRGARAPDPRAGFAGRREGGGCHGRARDDRGRVGSGWRFVVGHGGRYDPIRRRVGVGTHPGPAVPPCGLCRRERTGELGGGKCPGGPHRPPTRGCVPAQRPRVRGLGAEGPLSRSWVPQRERRLGVPLGGHGAVSVQHAPGLLDTHSPEKPLTAGFLPPSMCCVSGTIPADMCADAVRSAGGAAVPEERGKER